MHANILSFDDILKFISNKIRHLTIFRTILNYINMEDSIIQRVTAVQKHKGLSPKSFAEMIGFNYSTLNNYITGRRSSIDIDLIKKILSSFDDINIEWIINGSGNMIKNHKPVKDNYETKPRVPYSASAGALTHALDGVCEYNCEYIPIVKQFQKYDFTIFVRGDSMLPRYEQGDEIACTYINGSEFIQWGRPHVLDTTQGIVIKRIYDESEKIKCVSYNKDYPDFSIPKNEIFSISLIVGLLRM